ncbi:hypothetical protein R1flu_025141 [Riccia fluitans]|uniref:AI-2E family transporter n=1 Tax=Riccia fluitans TaxID=41844 RepID=A0ABD1XWY4_9MARC
MAYALVSSPPVTSSAPFYHLLSSPRKAGRRISSQWSVRFSRHHHRFGQHKKLSLRFGTCTSCYNQNESGARWPSADDYGGAGGEDQVPDSGARSKPHQSASRRVMAYDMAMKTAASPSSAPVPAGTEVGDLSSKMNGSRPDPYVILNLGSFVRRVPFQRLAVWASVALVMFQLRDFVGIIMGTIVLSVVGNSLVAWAEEYFPGRRRILVASMYAVIIAALVGIGIIYIPRLTQEGARVIARIQANEDPYTLISEKLRHTLGEPVTDQLERFLLVLTKPDTVVLESVAGSRAQRSTVLQQLIKDYAGAVVVWLATLISATSRFALQSMVSLIFSFMLVWDMPAIRRGVQSLKESRLSIVYQETAPVIVTFGRIFSKALQAQSAIAVVNTALTSLGLLILRVSGVGLLSFFVFLCSFVPVAGVIISTVPIGVVAFTEAGIWQLGLVLAMVILVHAVEAYILNPAIYSAHLKLHPLMALAVLVFAEHALGVWGLIVAVPMAVFFIEYVIKRNAMAPPEEPVSMKS